MEYLENKNILRYFLLVILAFLVTYFALNFIADTTVFFDEKNIIAPIMGHLQGKPYPPLIYPTFSFYFFEYFYKVFSLINPNMDLSILCRTINAYLLGLNFLLFYLASENLLDKSWRLLGAWFFALSPGVFYSSVVLKTESLQLMEILLSLYLTNLALKFPQMKRWCILSGVVAGLAVSTKYNPTLFLIYPLAQFFFNRNFFKKIDFFIFSISFFISILLTWTTIWELITFLKSKQPFVDVYFINYPTSAQAVNEWLSFPYGRYSYAFVFILPFAAGIPNYLGFLLGIFRTPLQVLAIWGGFTIAYLFIILNFTLMRLPHIFTVCLPFITLTSVFFWQNIYFKIKIPLLSNLLVFLLILWPLFHFADLGNGARSIIKVEMTELTKIVQKIGRQNIFFLLNNQNTQEINGVSGDRLAETILIKRPNYILALNTYMDSYCHYRQNQGYKNQCIFFKNLREGKENYKITWSKKINFSYLGLINQPHIYYLFERI